MNDNKQSNIPVNVCAIVITYFPDISTVDRIDDALQQVDSLIVIDNGTTGNALKVLNELSIKQGVTLLINAENIGHASALNQGVEQAKKMGFNWVLLLDQDSTLHPQASAHLVAILEQHAQPQKIAVIGSAVLERDTYNYPFIPLNSAMIEWDVVDSVFTSGSLLSIAAWESVGKFRDEFFIDYVDYEFSIRAARYNLQTLKSKAKLLKHVIGSPTTYRHFSGRIKWTTNHSASRRYYAARNNMILLKESGNYPYGMWLVRGWLDNLKKIKRILFFEKQKSDKITAIIHGGYDAINGKLGKRATK